MPNVRWLIALITAIHRFVYRVTGGRVGRRLGRRDMLLLTTVGRKSGKERTTPLLCVADGELLLVVASNGGDDRNPAWWLNLQARPEATVQLGKERREIRARQASPDEAEDLWPLLEASYSPYAEYRNRTSREIPVVLLEKRA